MVFKQMRKKGEDFSQHSVYPNNYPFDPNQKYETDFEIRFINFHVFL